MGYKASRKARIANVQRKVAFRWALLKTFHGRARVLDVMEGGFPLIEVDGARLAFRRHRRRGYFRAVVPCGDCGREVAWRDERIRRRRDVSWVVESASTQTGLCASCKDRRTTTAATAVSLKAEVARMNVRD
jgi:hypothetical protein